MTERPRSASGQAGVEVEWLLDRGRSAGLAAVGVAPASVLQPARDVLHLRKRAGLAGEMQFTYRNPDRSTDPATVLPAARSVVAGAWGYGHWRPPPAPGSAPRGRVARYAWHDHYQDLRRALETMAQPLRDAGHRAVVVADSNGLVDRNVAWSAGIGWYGKSTNVLLPGVGSWFVLGAVVTDAELAPTGSPLPDGCGPCNRCIDDCPTGAIVAPGVVDATRCLAWLVQADGWIPRRWRSAVGDRIYGCDDCQDVCPPNRPPRGVTGTAEAPSTSHSSTTSSTTTTISSSTTSASTATSTELVPEAELEQVEVDLDWLLTAPDHEILARHGRWYVAGRDVHNIRRTALVVLGNVGEPGRSGLRELLVRYLADADPRLRGHAVWAAKRLGLGELVGALADDDDPDVRAEVRAAVEPRFEPAAWAGRPLRPRTGGAPDGPPGEVVAGGPDA